MYAYDLELIKTVTNTTAEERQRLLNYWCRQAEMVKVEAVKFALDLVQQSGMQLAGKLPEVFYAHFLQALGRMQYWETAGAIKSKAGDDMKHLAKIQQVRIARVRASARVKPSPKTSTLWLQYGELILRLRAEGLGWRRIAQYLKRYHRQTVSHQTLYRLVRKYEKTGSVNPEADNQE